jgi:hypothetical protein
MLVLIIMEKLVCSNLNRKKKVKKVSDYLKKVFYQIMLNQFKQLFYLKSVGVIYGKAFYIFFISTLLLFVFYAMKHGYVFGYG